MKGIVEGTKKAGEVMKRALASGGACLVITIEKLPEGAEYRYFHVCLLNPLEIQHVLEDHPYLTMAQEVEERMRAEITASGPLN